MMKNYLCHWYRKPEVIVALLLFVFSFFLFRDDTTLLPRFWYGAIVACCTWFLGIVLRLTIVWVVSLIK